MQTILDTTSAWQRVRALGERAAIILPLLLGLSVARADFTGDFDASFWKLHPPVSSGLAFGSVYFTNANTELALVSPNTVPPTPGGESLDGILYDSPLQGALTVGGWVTFHWEVSAGDVQTGGASFGWQDASGESSTNLAVFSTPGFTNGADYSSPLLSPGTTNLSFLLDTKTTGSGKTLATLFITDFQFHETPEPSTGAFFAAVLVSLGAARWRRCRGQGSGRW